MIALLAPQSAGAELALEPIGEYEQPVYVTSDPDDADRLFIVEKAGRIMLTANGRTSAFLDQREITSTEGERGLLSIAFAADFGETGRFYIFYTRAPGGSLRVDEMIADGDVADLSSRRNLLDIPHPHRWHNGGQLHFGPDGYLYISTGDGGGEGDPAGNGQDPTTLLAALLRIDPREEGDDPYTIPPDNPFVGTDHAPEIWSWGLRNPWRFSFDRETGALTIGDVGQSEREEINYQPQELGGGRGDNFGWSCREGSVAFSEAPPECDEVEGFVDPVFDYPVYPGPQCAIIGGYVVRDPSLTGLEGRYLYTDLCTGELRSLSLDTPLAHDDCSEGLTTPGPSSFGEDAEGRIYVVSLHGRVDRIVGESERHNCVSVANPTTDDASPLIIALMGIGGIMLITGVLLLAPPRFMSRLLGLEDLAPIDHKVRIAAALLVAGGVVAAAVSVFAVELGLSAGGYGWKRIVLLAAGDAVAAVGVLLLARPGLVPSLFRRRASHT